MPLQPVGEILGIGGVDNIHTTLEDLEADEMLLSQKQRDAGDDGPSTSSLSEKLLDQDPAQH